VKYYVFAQILALCRPSNLPNPIRQLFTSGYSAYSCLIGLVVLIGRLSAMNLAKSPIGQQKTIVIIAHPCSETEFFANWNAFRLHKSIQYSETNNAIRFYLGIRTTAHREYMMGSTVYNLVKF
jgi:hypothetical protein